MHRSAQSDATVSTLMFRPILMTIEKAGIDVKELARRVGLSLEALSDRDQRLPRDLAIRTWLAAGEATNDDVFGIHVAETAPAGIYGALEYAIRSNANVGDALRELGRYYRIVSSLSSVVIEEGPDVIRILHKGESTPPAVVDNLFAVVVRVGRELTGAAFVPREVKLRRDAPKSRADHDRFFRAPVHFSSEADVLAFDAATLALPLLTADADLHAAFERRTEALLSALPSTDQFVRRARLAVVKSLQSGAGASLSVLANHLEMSVRTLQRRLSENATTRSDLVDSVRHELALRYLADNVGSTETAYLLGFAEAAAFHRAFKRWTGTTLKEHRARLREQR